MSRVPSSPFAQDDLQRKSEDPTPLSRRSFSSGVPGAHGAMELEVYSSADLARTLQQQASQQPPAGADDVRIGLGEGADVELLDPIPPQQQMVVEYSHVSAFVPASFGPPKGLVAQLTTLVTAPRALWHKAQKKDSQKEEFRQILFNITGNCKPGEVLALMGPSGSGKTTLLSMIGGRVPKLMRWDGAVLFNGEKLTKRAKRQVGFVLQDDLLYETLTVYETLLYAALLRLPRAMSRDEKRDRVRKVITALGLDKCRDTIIGGFFRRGISGGERKRVSVGHELLINPAVLLLDEPTSGLDSTTAMHLVQTLRRLASGGRAVVTTIHQPSSRLYQQLDKLLLLSDGHPMYYGKAALAAEWFSKLGYTMPYGVNVADFILDCASGMVSVDKRSAETSLAHMVQAAELYLGQHPEGYSQASQDRGGASVRRLALQAHQEVRKSDVARRLETVDLAEDANEGQTGDADLESGKPAIGKASALNGASRWGASYPMQLEVLFKRTVKTRRFETLSTQDFCQFIIIGVLVGLFWLQRANSDDISAGRDTVGLIFFELLFVGLRACFSALFTFPNEFKMMLKERASGMYRLSAFYFARTASDLPMDCSVPTIFIILVYFMGGLRYSAGAFFANWATTIMMLLVAQSLGLLIGASVMVPKTAQTIASVAVLGMTLVGGFYVTSIPGWISWMKYLSFIFYGYNLALKIEYGGRTLYDCSSGTCQPLSGQGITNALRLQRDVNEWPWEAIVLIGWLLFFRFWVYVALRRRTASSHQ